MVSPSRLRGILGRKLIFLAQAHTMRPASVLAVSPTAIPTTSPPCRTLCSITSPATAAATRTPTPSAARVPPPIVSLHVHCHTFGLYAHTPCSYRRWEVRQLHHHGSLRRLCGVGPRFLARRLLAARGRGCRPHLRRDLVIRLSGAQTQPRPLHYLFAPRHARDATSLSASVSRSWFTFLHYFLLAYPTRMRGSGWLTR